MRFQARHSTAFLVNIFLILIGYFGVLYADTVIFGTNLSTTSCNTIQKAVQSSEADVQSAYTRAQSIPTQYYNTVIRIAITISVRKIFKTEICHPPTPEQQSLLNTPIVISQARLHANQVPPCCRPSLGDVNPFTPTVAMWVQL